MPDMKSFTISEFLSYSRLCLFTAAYFTGSVVPVVVLDEVFYCLLHIIRQSPLAENIFIHSHQFVLESSWQQLVQVAYYISDFLMVFGLLPQSTFSLMVISSLCLSQLR